MTVKLNRLGYLFSIGTKLRLIVWLALIAYGLYTTFTAKEPDAVGAILLIIVVLVLETAAIFYFPITSFQVREGEIEYYDKINVGFGKNNKYEKMGFLIRDVKSIKIERAENQHALFFIITD